GGAVEDLFRIALSHQSVHLDHVSDRSTGMTDDAIRPQNVHELQAKLSVGAEDKSIQSVASSACGAVGSESSAVISDSGAGLPTRKPCAASQPASISTASAIRSWSPSATTRSPRL